MRCRNCYEEISVENCSAKEGLVFFGVCQSCKVVNKFEIDLDKNEIVSNLCHDEEVEQASRLFKLKNKKLSDKADKLSKGLDGLVVEDAIIDTGTNTTDTYMVDSVLEAFNKGKVTKLDSNQSDYWGSFSDSSQFDIMNKMGNGYFKLKK